MMKIRNVAKTIKGQETVDGAGVHLIRVLGDDDVEDIDPFLMLDAFDSKYPEEYIKGFPMHPHRGIETITYLISGEIDHKDSLGNTGKIKDGESQWMTAGSGILHEEMPKESDRLYGLQIWLNLPKKDKMVDPEYLDIHNEMIREIEIPEGKIRVISGNFNGIEGVSPKHVQASIFDISLKVDSEINIEVKDENNLFVYLFEGNGVFGDNTFVDNRTVAIFSKGDTLHAKAGTGGVRFLLCAGKPLHEPIAWAGPIVMNDENGLIEAFKDLNEGKFIKQN
ncbi:pirin family protein [Methanobrevibacter sp. DSM 116169]|uniref:pirin family protein n=1 Tax=Methanobrevibacter sp. DSM 116169 TaxID=3242727 RepID=UPI0038FC0983